MQDDAVQEKTYYNRLQKYCKRLGITRGFRYISITYLPCLLTIILFVRLWNFLHSSLSCNSTFTISELGVDCISLVWLNLEHSCCICKLLLVSTYTRSTCEWHFTCDEDADILEKKVFFINTSRCPGWNKHQTRMNRNWKPHKFIQVF